MEQQGKIHGNKPRGKLDLNLENVTGNVITLEIAEKEFMYEWDICKNTEEYTWNKSTTTIKLIFLFAFGRHFVNYFLNNFPWLNA